MSAPRANLHKSSVADAARLMNVSKRSVYEAHRLIRSGREDLCRRVQAGELSLHAALIEAGLKRKAESDRLSALCRAWNACTESERTEFVGLLKGSK